MSLDIHVSSFFFVLHVRRACDPRVAGLLDASQDGRAVRARYNIGIVLAVPHDDLVEVRFNEDSLATDLLYASVGDIMQEPGAPASGIDQHVVAQRL